MCTVWKPNGDCWLGSSWFVMWIRWFDVMARCSTVGYGSGTMLDGWWGSDHIISLIIYFICCFNVRPDLSSGFSSSGSAHGVGPSGSILVPLGFVEACGTSVIFRDFVSVSMTIPGGIQVEVGGSSSACVGWAQFLNE